MVGDHMGVLQNKFEIKLHTCFYYNNIHIIIDARKRIADVTFNIKIIQISIDRYWPLWSIDRGGFNRV